MTFNKLAQRDPSNQYFERQCTQRQEVIFVTYQGVVIGIIERSEKYALKLKGRDELLAKHDILYLFKPDARTTVESHVTLDEDVIEEGLNFPELKLLERLQIPVELLHQCYQKKQPVIITMRNGEVLSGVIFKYGVFSIRLSLTVSARVIIMKLNIYDFELRKER